ncbi:MAG: hypothetical protein JWO13_2399 [Acidobacteriales bacterium]|nr:hypothetical protein [Terriglobales bacterium]
MQSMSTISFVLWIASPILQSTMVIIISKNGVWKEIPVFFAYTGFHVFRSVLLFWIRSSGSPQTYGQSYWAAEVISVILGFAVIYEIFNQVLKRYEGIRQLGLMLLRWSGFVLTLVAIISTSTSTSGDFAVAMGTILSLERSIRFIQCGLVIFLFLFASTLALSWRHYAFGVAVGFGLFAGVELILVAIRAQVGPNADSAYVLIKPVTYVCACLVWTGYLLAPVPAPKTLTGPSTKDLEKWNQTVLELMHQ